MYTDWFALVNCVVSLVVVGTQVPKNLLLPSQLHKYNRNYLHFSRTFVVSLWKFGQATTAWHIRNTSHCKITLSEMSSTRVYNVRNWFATGSLFQYLGVQCTIHFACCTASSFWWAASRPMQCLSDDGVIHFTLRVATSLPKAAQCQNQCKAYKLGRILYVWI
jgi:hypothetical protein